MDVTQAVERAPAGRPLTNKGQASREAVLRAAADAFMSRGFAATSIDDIADRLGGSKGRVYHYFRTKGEIFLGIHQLALEMVISTVEPLSLTSRVASARIHEMVSALAGLMMTETSFMRVAATDADMHLAAEGRTRVQAVEEIRALRARYQSMFERVVEDGVTSGEFRTPTPDLLANALLGALHWITVWYQPERAAVGHSVQDVAKTYADFIVAGLRG
jgi:AcrR family transcriptional regulator